MLEAGPRDLEAHLHEVVQRLRRLHQQILELTLDHFDLARQLRLDLLLLLDRGALLLLLALQAGLQQVRVLSVGLQLRLLLQKLIVEWVLERQGERAKAALVHVVRLTLAPLQLDEVSLLQLHFFGDRGLELSDLLLVQFLHLLLFKLEVLLERLQLLLGLSVDLGLQHLMSLQLLLAQQAQVFLALGLELTEIMLVRLLGDLQRLL